MAPKVLKIIVVADDETAGLIMDWAALTIKERETSPSPELVSFTDANAQEHQLHFVLAEEV